MVANENLKTVKNRDVSKVNLKDCGECMPAELGDLFFLSYRL